MKADQKWDDVRIRPSTLYRDLDGEGVLLQLDLGEYYTVEGVANHAWQLLAASTLQQTFETLAREYEVERSELAADLATFVGDLAGSHLIDIVTPAGPG